MTVLTIQPPTIDNYLDASVPTSNYGGLSLVYLYGAGYPYVIRSLLQFNFSSLPDGQTITEATLSLYLQSGSVEGRTCWAYELTREDWVELQSTWRMYKGTMQNPYDPYFWTTYGGDYTTDNGASIVAPASGWHDWDVKALVQHFQASHGKIANFLLRLDNEGCGSQGAFYSKDEETQLTLRPKLVITYAPAGYTLAAGSGIYTKTGQGAGLRAARKMAAAPDSYALTGKPVDLRLARKIAAGSGSYLSAGQDAALQGKRLISAGGGSYVLAGQDANLVLAHRYKLIAEAGCYGEPYSKIFVTLDGKIYKKMGNTYLRLS